MFNAPLEFVKRITGEGESWERFFNSAKSLDPRKEWLEACNVSFFSLHGATRRRRMTMMKALATIYTWRLHKQIYSFDETLEHLLCEETDQTMIPVEVLHRLPKSFYVATKTFCDMDGFFVSVVDGQGEEDVTIYLVILFTSGDFGFVSCTFSQNCGSLSDISIQAESAKQFSSAEQLFKLLQLVLYVASDRKAVKKVSSEVVVYNVGDLSQSAYRKAKDSAVAEEEKHGTRKKPHYRRAHWHTYWIGPRGRNRKMILRWNPPVFVNYHEKGEARCVIEEIEA